MMSKSQFHVFVEHEAEEGGEWGEAKELQDWLKIMVLVVEAGKKRQISATSIGKKQQNCGGSDLCD